MGEVNMATRIQEKAKLRVKASLARAKDHYLSNLKLGEQKVDPRTEKKRAEANKPEPGLDTTLSRLLYEMRNNK